MPYYLIPHKIAKVLWEMDSVTKADRIKHE